MSCSAKCCRMSSRKILSRLDSRATLSGARNSVSVCWFTLSTRISCMQRITNSGCTSRKVRKSVMSCARSSSSMLRMPLKSSSHSDTGECSNRPLACCSLRRRARSERLRSVESSTATSTRDQSASWPGGASARTVLCVRRLTLSTAMACEHSPTRRGSASMWARRSLTPSARQRSKMAFTPLKSSSHRETGARSNISAYSASCIGVPVRRGDGGRSSVGVKVSVRVGEAQAGQDLALARLHGLGFLLLEVVPALGVQGAVHQHVGVVGLQRLALLLRILLDHGGADDQVGHHHGLLRVVEGQHVGGVVLLSEVAVQGLALFGVDQAHGDLGIGAQRRLDPAGHLVAGQGVLVALVGELQAQGEGGLHAEGLWTVAASSVAPAWSAS